MKIKNTEIKKILEKYKEIAILTQIDEILGYDMQVSLPQKGGEGRAAQSAYITKLLTEKWSDPELKTLVNDVDDKNLTPEETPILRNIRHAGYLYWNVPKEVIIKFAETSSKAFMAWADAKKNNSFKDFLPHLVKTVHLNQIVAEHLGAKDNLYDALLDHFEPGLTTKECKNIFGILQPELTKIVKSIQKSKNYTSESEIIGGAQNYPIDDQIQLTHFVLRRMNYDFDSGRQDIASHPFTSTLGKHDVRVTNRFKVNNFIESVMIALHEGGHALYEQGVRDEYKMTPLDGGTSLGIHESQSRFWENQVGRSEAFVRFITPVLHALYPEQLTQYGEGALTRIFCMVRPGFIRTEADEVTYNLHLALRFEIEEGLINGKLKVKDLPELWRAKMKEYLGVTPPTDREGVLQDVHWASNFGGCSFGYFPTYTLGNLYAAQFTDTMRKELGVEELVASGEFGTIHSWLRTNIHQYGSLYWPKELVKKVTDEALDPKYFLRYVKEKYGKVYEVSLK